MPREQTSSSRSPDVAGSEFFDTLREMGRNWMERASAEAERGSKLSKDLSNAHSVPDAVTAYQGWFSSEMNARIYSRFAIASLDLSERGRNLADKSRVLIVAEAWLDLAEETTQLVERETSEAHRIIKQPLISMTLKAAPPQP